MPDTTTDQPTYEAMHSRLNYRQGLARRHPCVDCGAPARHWSYDHQDPNELTSPKGLEYSTNPKHYQPRCRTCHHDLDKRYRRSGIPRLHSLAKELEPQIRTAVYERERARKFGDFAKMVRWDEELDKLIDQLQTARADMKRRA